MDAEVAVGDKSQLLQIDKKSKVTMELRIQMDGRLVDNFPKIVTSSGIKNLDDSCLAILRNAFPFEPLPRSYSRSFIELRITFSSPTPAKAQKKINN